MLPTASSRLKSRRASRSAERHALESDHNRIEYFGHANVSTTKAAN